MGKLSTTCGQCCGKGFVKQKLQIPTVSQDHRYFFPKKVDSHSYLLYDAVMENTDNSKYTVLASYSDGGVEVANVIGAANAIATARAMGVAGAQIVEVLPAPKVRMGDRLPVASYLD